MKPLIAKYSELKNYAKRLERGFRIVSSTLFPDELLWSEGKWSEKMVFINDAFEVGFFDSHHKQDFHAHTHSYEIYIFMGKGLLKYLDSTKNCIAITEIEEGDIVIFPPGMYHELNIGKGFGYSILIKEKGYLNKPDKIILKNKKPVCNE